MFLMHQFLFCVLLNAVKQLFSIAKSNLQITITYEHSVKLTFIFQIQYSATFHPKSEANARKQNLV